ncbi:MAG: YcxB family protein [Clostridia bacterium]|jgi:hypothetical protein|nr:YcxB family protein [Clostridia bacterium]
MEIKYEVIKEDVLDFNMYVLSKSSTAKRSLFLQRFAGPVIFMIFALLLNVLRDESVFIYVPFVIASLIWVLLYPRYFTRHVEKHVSKMLNEGENKAMVGKHILSVNPDEIIETTDVGETKIRWNAIQKIVVTERQVYIFFGEMMAFIIPLRSFDEDIKLQDFVGTIKEFQSKANSYPFRMLT